MVVELNFRPKTLPTLPLATLALIATFEPKLQVQTMGAILDDLRILRLPISNWCDSYERKTDVISDKRLIMARPHATRGTCKLIQ